VLSDTRMAYLKCGFDR